MGPPPAAALPDPRTAFARCVGDVDDFVSRIWGRRHHLHHDDDTLALLSLEDVDHILATMALRAPAFRLVKAGRTLPASEVTRRARVGSRDLPDLIDVGRVHAAFRDGATIVLQGVHRYWPAVTAFCHAVEDVLTHPVQANAYITPPVAQGLRVHADAHDVLAIHTYGRKHWVVYEPASAPAGLVEPQGSPVIDRDLVAGDCLYLPRGTPHAARTVDIASVHLTVGVRGQTWGEVLRSGVESALAGADEVLPAGYAHQPGKLREAAAEQLRALAAALVEADPAASLEAAARRFWLARSPSFEGQLPALVEEPAIDDSSVLRRRRAAACLVERHGEQIEVVLSDRRLWMPAAAERAMRFVAERPVFRLEELAPMLDGDSRRGLARRLVREGLLTLGG